MSSSPKENTSEQRKKDLDLLGEVLGPLSQIQKSQERINVWDALSMGGTSEERQAIREHQQKESSEAKQKEAEKRKENIDKKANAIKKASEKAIEDVQKIFNSDAEDLLDNLKDTVKDAIKGKDADIDKIVGGYKKAEKEVKKVLNQAKQIQSYLKDPKKALQEVGLKVLSNEGLLKLQQAILSGKMAEALTFDNIVSKVTEYWNSAKDSFKSITEKLAAKKAYISAFIKSTFSDPEYMKKLTEGITSKIQDTVKNLACEKINGLIGKAEDKFNSVFSKIEGKLDQITSKVYTKLDSLTKLNCLTDLNKKLQGVLSMDSLMKKLNGTAFGKLLSGPLGKIGDLAKGKIADIFKSEKYTKTLGKVTEAFKKISSAVQKAKDFVKEKVQMIKDYVNNIKEQAMNAVKEYASKIVSDIASKINIGGAISGALGGVLG